ncbi:MAG: dual specificity protein phosphatase family protein [Bacteroidota bacterium]
MRLFKGSIQLWSLLFLLGCSNLAMAQNPKLEKVDSNRFKRLYQLNDTIFRSEQPNRRGFKELEALGLKTSINFRRNKKDTRKASGTGIQLIHIPLKTAELTEGQLLNALRAIQIAEKPVLVHCWHGSDRTGAIMAAYRIIFEDWSKEEAIQELRKPELGYHEKWYPNVIELISNLDEKRIRKELGL